MAASSSHLFRFRCYNSFLPISTHPLEGSSWSYLHRQTFTFHSHIFPEQFPAALDSTADHVYQTKAVGQWLRVRIIGTGDDALVDKGRERIMVLDHERVRLQIVEDEFGSSPCPGLGRGPMDK